MSISEKVMKLSAAQKRKKKHSDGFFLEMKQELKRVSWTPRAELKKGTKIVVLAIFLLGIGIYLADLFIRLVLSGVGNIVHWIGK